MRIAAEEVEALLNGAIGAELTAQAGLTDLCVRLMNAWQPVISPPEELEKRLSDGILHSLDAITGPKLTYRPAEGPAYRFTVASLDEVAAQLMALPLSRLPVNSQNEQLLRAFAYSTDRAAIYALFFLHTRYPERQRPEEYAMQARVLRENGFLPETSQPL